MNMVKRLRRGANNASSFTQNLQGLLWRDEYMKERYILRKRVAT